MCNWQGVYDYLQNLPPTKKSVLRFGAKIFDPLGILSPFTIHQKLMFQTLCLNRKAWDEPLDGELLKQWNNLRLEIMTLEQVQLPRCYFNADKKPFLCQLPGFYDASEKAYAAVIYLRTVYTDSSVELCLVGSKTRLAPIKGQTILFYWTDSYTVLCWIHNQKPWKQYVLRRIQEIHKLTCADH